MPVTEISQKSSEYLERVLQWGKVRDVIEGEERVKSKTTLYLPRPEAQNNKQYKSYRKRAVFYGVAERTLRGLVGLVFRVEPTVELPDALEALDKSATPRGFPLDTLMRDAVREVVSLGRFGMLVDMPQEPRLIGDAVPFIAPYTAENIWRWEEEFDPIQGMRRLTRVVLREDPATMDDTERTFLRELFLDPDTGAYMQQLWVEEVTETSRGALAVPTRFQEEILSVGAGGFVKEGPPMMPRMNGAPLTEIPFFFINTFNLSATPDKPPMLDLANMNLAHYRNSADFEHALYLTAQPTPWAADNWANQSKPTSIGSGSIWLLSPNGKVGMLEFTGAGLEAIAKAMDSKEERMAALGARLIRDQERSNVTAETTRLQMTAETSVLLSAVSNTEAGIDAVLRFAAEWAGGNPDDVNVQLNRDFFETRLAAQEILALVTAWQQGAYSRDTLHTQLQRGEIIDPKRTVEEEVELIEEETPDTPPALTDATDALAPGGEGEPELEAGGSIDARGTTAQADGHAHAFTLTIADDGTISGEAAEANGHVHAISRLDRTEEADGHTHALPLSGGARQQAEQE